MSKTLDDFYNDLGVRESGGNYQVINKWGYVGKYQMGEAAMVDAGYYKKASRKYNNDWSGQFTGKDGVYRLQDFLNNKQAQENAQKSFKQAQWRQLKSVGADKYIGKEINGVKITQSGLLAASHLKGPQSVIEYLSSNGQNIPKDALGTSVESYMKKFGGYDVSEITGLKNSEKSLEERTSKITNPIEGSPLFKMGIEYNFKLPEKDHIFTPDEIGKMSREEFEQNEDAIMKQLQNGQIKNEAPKIDYENYKNSESGSSRIFTREDVDSMSAKEYEEHEKEIMAQIKEIGMPFKQDVPNSVETYSKEKRKFEYESKLNEDTMVSDKDSSDEDGKWVTINGNHVLLKD